jgi:Alr-MurF fusion protein
MDSNHSKIGSMDRFDLRQWTGFQKAGGNISEPAFVDQISIDSRRIASKEALFVALQGDFHDGHKFILQAAKAGARFALVRQDFKDADFEFSPDYACVLLRVENPLTAFQEIAQTYRKQQHACKTIAVAGSYGKTMVKDLLQALLSRKFSVAASPESFNSQIGVPLSLLTIEHTHQIALIEAAISKQNEMDSLNAMIAPEYAVITHIGKKHLPTLNNLETIAAETVKLLLHPPKKQWVILPKDPYLLAQLPANFSGVHYFWTEQYNDLPHASYITDISSDRMSYKIHFPDGQEHFGQITSGFYYFLDLINITVKSAWLLGISAEAISSTLREYHPEPIRMEIWKSSLGTTFINDSYCSDPLSVDKALKYLSGSSENSRKIFAFGGMRAVQQHQESAYRRVGKAIHRAQVDLLYLFGQHQFQPLMDEVKVHAPATQIHLCPSYKEMLQMMKGTLQAEDVVLIKGDHKQSINELMQMFNESLSSNQCYINLAAIAYNLETLRKKLAEKTRLMMIVKALAYGTDAILMSKFLETCHVNILGVSFVDEGVSLKRAGVSQAIFVIQATVHEVFKVVKWELEIGVSDRAMLDAVAQEAEQQNKKIKVHLHIDTGMGRFGCRSEDALQLAQLIQNHSHLELEGVMTHFACADDPAQDAFTHEQAAAFQRTIDQLKSEGVAARWIHAANSSGAIRFHFPQFNMVRIGLAAYGLHSSAAVQNALELRLALSLTSRIVGINSCKAGETVSYGRSYRVHKNFQSIAVLPIGYFDGLHCNYSGKGSVIIRGQKAPMIGKICMDFMMVDVTDIPSASVGDPVLIFGEDEHGYYISPEELATQGASIVHELITCLGPRIQRIFVHEESRTRH